MALTAQQRISISKKIIEIPEQNAAAEQAKLQIEPLRAEAEAEDSANQALAAESDALANLYHPERSRYDGNIRVNLLEQDILDSANKLFQNKFFPNDAASSVPSLPDNIWKNFAPFSGNIAIGKKYDELYDTSTAEETIITQINADITTIESHPYVAQERSTGQRGLIGFGGDPDAIVTYDAIQTLNTSIKNGIQSLKDFVNTTYPLIPEIGDDADIVRSSENDAARQAITDLISAINTWQALNDFDTSHGLPSSGFGIFSAFYSLDVNNDLGPTKYRASELQPLKDALTTRESFVTTRQSQIDGYLGTIDQNFTTGIINSTSGFYGDRFRIIDLRLNLMGGSLTKLTALQNAKNSQDALISTNNNALITYNALLTAVRFRAPGTNLKIIHVLSTSGFQVGDSIFVVSNSQPELSGTIVNISGDAVELSFSVSHNYRENDGARLYKEL